jgi:hypothetical protein
VPAIQEQSLIISKYPKIFNLLDSIKRTNHADVFKAIIQNSRIQKTEYYDKFILHISSQDKDKFKELYNIWYNILYNNVTYSSTLPYCNVPFSKIDNSCEIIIMNTNENFKNPFEGSYALTLSFPSPNGQIIQDEPNGGISIQMIANIEYGEYVINVVHQHVNTRTTG